MNTRPYDLVVIGTGTAAIVASARVRAAGWSVAVIDHRPFGGTCSGTAGRSVPARADCRRTEVDVVRLPDRRLGHRLHALSIWQ
jgi:pyruvate/2-oxoglutarate dehydrogenase complex dihydrolipoamide dehydrogenase (E3) component